MKKLIILVSLVFMATIAHAETRVFENSSDTFAQANASSANKTIAIQKAKVLARSALSRHLNTQNLTYSAVVKTSLKKLGDVYEATVLVSIKTPPKD